MDTEILTSVLMWCSVMNYSILILWILMLTFAKDWFYSLQAHWFPLTREELIRCNYLLYGSYKLAILVLNVIPWIALKIVHAT